MKNFTVGTMYWVNPNATDEELRSDMAAVKANGIGLLRTFVPWESVEKSDGIFDFSLFDRFFRAAEAYGIPVMPTLVFYLPLFRIKSLMKQGIDDTDRWVPCLDRPEVKGPLTAFFQACVTRYKDSPVLSQWNVWNEPADPPCLCPDSLNKLAAWLKKEYPTMAALREGWAGEHFIFQTALPDSLEEIDGAWLEETLRFAIRGRSTSLRLDQYRFQEQHSAEHLAELAAIVKKLDPDHPCHSNFAVVTCNPHCSGLDPFLAAQSVDEVSGSLHPSGMFGELRKNTNVTEFLFMLFSMDMIHAWGNGRPAWIGEYQGGTTCWKPVAYTPRGEEHFATLFHSLARGLQGVIFWEWQSWRQSIKEPGEFSLRNPSDGGPTERSRAVERFAGIVKEHQAFFDALEPDAPAAAILCSTVQSRAEWVMNEGPENRSSLDNAHLRAVMACHRALTLAGIPVQLVSERTLTSETLSRFKVLYLPGVQTMSQETAELIRAFVVHGGAVWADGRCASFDEPFFLRKRIPWHGLDEVFGCREIDHVAPRPGEMLTMVDGNAIPPYREIQLLAPAPEAEVLARYRGTPAAVRRAFGKGETELWGTPLCRGEAMEGDERALPLIQSFARRHGLASAVPWESDGDLRCSCARSGERRVIVVTNCGSVDGTLKLPAAAFPHGCEEWCLRQPGQLFGEKIVFTVPAARTLCIVSC